MDPENKRLEENRTRQKNWQRWGPYLSERQWSTVREDYSANGDAWEYFPHDMARSRVYRWGEDGILGITDRECRLCFALSFWNGKDPFLKERLFGLTDKQGNHGEDVKECYYYLESTPTHSYMSALYKYPIQEFPYKKLIEENKKRGLQDNEYELLDTGIFEGNNYFDIYAEYAKNSPDDLLIRIKIINRSDKTASLHFLPTLWFRNTWSWNPDDIKKPLLQEFDGIIEASHHSLSDFLFFSNEKPIEYLFTENETNNEKLFGVKNTAAHVKDAFHEYVVHGNKEAIHRKNGTKMAPYYVLDFVAGETKVFDFRLVSKKERPHDPFGKDFDKVFELRKKEADEFYQKIIPTHLSSEDKKIALQAYAGLLWSKQFYHYVEKEWIEGDPLQPPPPHSRKFGRNKEWKHLYARDVLSVPDKWEYPWFAAWDHAFHMIPFSKVDPDFAKKQMVLFLREWYMHPNGQLPAYEYSFSDVNPPVHAWAAWRIYKMTGKKGERDVAFLESVFQKLLMNFTWWLNRKDLEGNNIFGGGFLGLDNIGVFNRSAAELHGMVLQQADATAWMAFYCLSMLSMAIELAAYNHAYEDIASKFFEHFVLIADAIHERDGAGLWHEEDGFYYDQLKFDGNRSHLRIRSLVGLIPLLAIEVLEQEQIDALPSFKKRMNWFLDHRKDLNQVISYCNLVHDHRILALPSEDRLYRLLTIMLDENEFLSPYGIRSLSKYHEKHPYIIKIGNEEHCISYAPGEANTYLFGGNSNWRGPIWFPINYLIIEALERYHHFYGDYFVIDYPTGSGKLTNLKTIAQDLSKRLTSLFHPNESGQRPSHGPDTRYRDDPYFKDLILFYEYFHGETGRGLGASHQTGWTSLITKLQ